MQAARVKHRPKWNVDLPRRALYVGSTRLAPTEARSPNIPLFAGALIAEFAGVYFGSACVSRHRWFA